MRGKVFKNEEKKIPLARLSFLLASTPSAELDLCELCYCFSVSQAPIISMLWQQQR